MKTTVKWITIMTVALLLTAGPALAGKRACTGNQMGNQAKQQMSKQIGGQNCPMIAEGEPVSIFGTVYEEAAGAGDGLVVDTGDGTLVTVYGIGPFWYWESRGIPRPVMGESIQIDALRLVYSDGTERLIAVTIVVDGETIALRDPVDGKTLWRRAGRR